MRFINFEIASTGVLLLECFRNSASLAFDQALRFIVRDFAFFAIAFSTYSTSSPQWGPRITAFVVKDGSPSRNTCNLAGYEPRTDVVRCAAH